MIVSRRQLILPSPPLSQVCFTLMSIWNFTGLAKFAWMSVEGVYLVLVVLCPFRVDGLKASFFCVTAWGKWRAEIVFLVQFSKRFRQAKKNKPILLLIASFQSHSAASALVFGFSMLLCGF